MENKILSILQALEKEQGIKVLLAVESGSRAWGFPSPDSDFDVRIIFAHPRNRYLSLHTVRLLDMAYEILRLGKVIVKRPNREELLNIRKGVWSYEDLILMANERMVSIEKAYEKSTLL